MTRFPALLTVVGCLLSLAALASPMGEIMLDGQRLGRVALQADAALGESAAALRLPMGGRGQVHAHLTLVDDSVDLWYTIAQPSLARFVALTEEEPLLGHRQPASGAAMETLAVLALAPGETSLEVRLHDAQGEIVASLPIIVLAAGDPALQAAPVELTDASRALVQEHFHAGAGEYVHGRDMQAANELVGGLSIDPEHQPSLALLKLIMERQQQEQQQQDQEQQEGEQQEQDETQEGEGEQEQQTAAQPEPEDGDEGEDEEEAQDEGEPETDELEDPDLEQQEQQVDGEMTPEEAEALLDQLAREEEQRRREQSRERRSAQIRVEQDW